MNQPDSKTKKKSPVLDLESLNAQYRNYLIEYQQAVANYMNYLKEEASINDINKKWSYDRGVAYWGTTSIGQDASSSLQECQASCSTTSGCTGATFNLDKKICLLRGGEGDVVAGLKNDYAILPKGNKILSIIQKINQKLVDTNQQIQKKTNNSPPLNNPQSKLKTAELINQFIQLSQEREKITKILKDYKTLDQEQNQGNIMINQNYYSFLLLLGLAVIILYILYKIGLSSYTQL